MKSMKLFSYEGLEQEKTNKPKETFNYPEGTTELAQKAKVEFASTSGTNIISF